MTIHNNHKHEWKIYKIIQRKEKKSNKKKPGKEKKRKTGKWKREVENSKK